MNAYAGNGTLSLAYYIAPANITLSLGGRYQIIYYEHSRGLRGFLHYDMKFDHFYGASLSVIYAFHIKKK
jgi:hypothetical protein